MRISDWSSDVCSSDLYCAGLVLGALRAGIVVRRVGHIRAFAAFVALLSASTLAYALLQQPMVWGALRIVDGICVAGVFICLESWLNDRAEPGKDRKSTRLNSSH